MSDKLENSVRLCREYEAKNNLLGGCKFVFFINKNENSQYFGFIELMYTRKGKYNILKIPEFVNFVGNMRIGNSYKEDDFIILGCNADEKRTFNGFNYALEYLDAEKVILGENIIGIGNYAFNYSKVKCIEINTKVKRVKSNAFNRCDNLCAKSSKKIKELIGISIDT